MKSKSPTYKYNDRVEYIYKPIVRIGLRRISHESYQHGVGYIKKRVKTLFGKTKYYIIRAGKDANSIIDLVNADMVIGTVELKENKSKQIKYNSIGETAKTTQSK